MSSQSQEMFLVPDTPVDFVDAYGTMQVRVLSAVLYFTMLVFALRMLRTLVSHQLRSWARKTSTDLDDRIVAVLEREGKESTLVFSYGIISAWLAAHAAGLDLADSPVANVEPAVRGLVLLLASWRASAVVYGIIAATLSSDSDGGKGENRRAVEVVLKATQLGLLCTAALFVCDNLGVSVHSLLTTFGVLSISGTLSSQAVLTDAISYLAVSLDKPFEVGDFVKVAGAKMGKVISIGWKTTRVRALDGETMVFTNSDVAKSRLSNYKDMSRRRTKFTVHFSKDTPVSFLKELPDVVAKAVAKESAGEFQCCTILGDGFSAASGIACEIIYFGLGLTLVEFKQMQHRINIRMLESFERAGVRVVEPTGTMPVACGPR